MARRSVPFGEWPAPISASMVVERAVALAGASADGDDVYWIEGRPSEGGRQVLVRRPSGGEPRDLTPAPFSVRSRVHEYGGGAYLVDGGVVWFSNFSDGRLYRQAGPDDPPTPVTPEPPAGESLRYADLRRVPGPARGLVAVREHHRGNGEIRNEIVWLPDGEEGAGHPLVTGRDFVAAPRPDRSTGSGRDAWQLAWVAWDLPAMPWQSAEVWVADVAEGPGGPSLSGARRVAGGPGAGASGTGESAVQPDWLPDGSLVFASDRTGWWNLYRAVPGATVVDPLLDPQEAEFAGPAWILDTPWYAVLPDGQLACKWAEGGTDHLGVIDVDRRTLRRIHQPYTTLAAVRPAPGGVVTVAMSPTEFPAVVHIGPDGAATVLRRSQDLTLDPGWISIPRQLEFGSAAGRRAHAIYYPPTNPDCAGPDGERPPLLVTTHGGPTGCAFAALNLAVLYWTSRGFGVVDVNYGGSTGFGRAYRELLDGRWGIVDVEDTVAAARYLVDTGEADPDRLVVRGASAGGWTTLCGLTFTDTFAAGASYYGIGDAEALARDTHKFESRYLDGLIGPWPEAVEVYRQRSPVHHTEQLRSPLILFQGLDDPVVPPNQAEMMVEALRAKGLPFAYVAFPGEQHGFRSAATIRRCLEAELSFYGQVLGFTPADDIEPVRVQNLPSPLPPATAPDRPR